MLITMIQPAIVENLHCPQTLVKVFIEKPKCYHGSKKAPTTSMSSSLLSRYDLNIKVQYSNAQT